MKNVRAICFDLDDTLWDLRPVIPKAEQALYEWYRQNCPRVVELYSEADIAKVRDSYARENPELRYDLTALRMLTLNAVAENAGYGSDTAEQAFGVFQEARNSVDLYEDVLPGLQKLAERFRLLTLSNGNADLEAIGIADYFEHSYSARELGVAKPDVAIFHAVSLHAGVAGEDIVHVGDHPENDIVAAREAGWLTVWVNRQNGPWPADHPRPDYAVSCLRQLAQLFEV
jgi:2-haloalkanoic acid dehalogenase type II